jgi:hypothetical protein
VEWVSPFLALAGVFAGSWLTRQSGETAWLRETRIDRYTKLLLELDKFVDSFDEFFQTLATPEAFASRAEWDAAKDERADAVSKASDGVRWTCAEVSLFASRRVSDCTSQMLVAIRDILGAFTTPVAAESPTAQQREAGAAGA